MIKVPLNGVLAVVAAASVLVSLVMTFQFGRLVRASQGLNAQARQLQGQVVLVSRNRALMQALARDAIEYGKRNPAMASLLKRHGKLLEQLNLRPPSAADGVRAPANP